MSAIDQFRHRDLGFIHCPSNEDFVLNNATREIAVYELLENIPVEEKDFDGKAGDILLGGGSGEASAFRVSIPEAIHYFTERNIEDIHSEKELYKSFWSLADSRIFSEGYAKLGWNKDVPIEFWLAKNICFLLIENFDQYSNFKSEQILESDLNFI